MAVVEDILYTYLGYFLGTSFCFFILEVVLSRVVPAARINPKQMPTRRTIFQEIKWSLSTALIFSLTFYFLFHYAVPHGWTQIYEDIGSRGYAYFIFSIIFLIFFTETLYYWNHRILHLPFFFRKAHYIHHRFKNPTPFANWAFHPTEAITQSICIFVLPLFIIPVHEMAYFLYLVFFLISNATGHSGVEFMPAVVVRHPLWRFHNTPTHHNMHHRYVNYNFGLYFNFWDRLFRTNHPSYEKEFLQHAHFNRTAERTDSKSVPRKTRRQDPIPIN